MNNNNQKRSTSKNAGNSNYAYKVALIILIGLPVAALVITFIVGFIRGFLEI